MNYDTRTRTKRARARVLLQTITFILLIKNHFDSKLRAAQVGANSALIVDY